MKATDDLRITATKEVVSPKELMQDLPITDAAADTVYNARQEIYRILDGEDDRLLIIVGPCSIHDPKAAYEYAERLKQLREELKNDLMIVMRVYFEKPRTTIGWKGLINDPGLDESYEINRGVRLAREVLLTISDMGVPAGSEYLDLISPQYISDLVSWGAIGARTTESQGHRELASGLSCPVGFKNGTNGSMSIAIDAMNAAAHSHHFMSLTKEGHSAIFCTSGNQYTHIILRGGKDRPNYDRVSVNQAAEELNAKGLRSRFMVDCSHANSQKIYKNQITVAHDIAQQISHGQKNIMGVMIESHLHEGRQDIGNAKNLKYGQSITDACIGWDDSEVVLRELAEAVRMRRDC